MKKLLFSAIALVAFSSVSMGNTVEVNQLNKQYFQPVEVNCDTVATEALLAADPDCTFTPTQAFKFYRAQFKACEDSKKSLSLN